MAEDRRQKFRDYMAHLDPIADPATAIDNNYYVAPPNGAGSRLGTLLELEEGSLHLLIGGIGSGKTTELHQAARHLQSVHDIDAVYVDVPRQQQSNLGPGVLIAFAAKLACERIEDIVAQGARDADVDKAVAEIQRLIDGYNTDYPDFDYDEEPPVTWVPGLLRPPLPNHQVDTLEAALRKILPLLPRRLVVIFDGLDRMSSAEHFAHIMKTDIPALSRIGIGGVVVAPLTIRFGQASSVHSLFRTTHIMGSYGTDTTEGTRFLVNVLRKRVGQDTLLDEGAEAIAAWSGGVLRDLIGIARAAGAESYSVGHDVVATEDVNTAAERFGRDLLLGCHKDMVRRLKLLTPRNFQANASGGLAFTVATDVDQKILLGRLIVEIPGPPVKYIFHPTIVSLLSGLRP